MERSQKMWIAEQIWLGYFNRVLFEQGVITETDRNRIAQKIETRKPPAKKPASICIK